MKKLFKLVYTRIHIYIFMYLNPRVRFYLYFLVILSIFRAVFSIIFFQLARDRHFNKYIHLRGWIFPLIIIQAGLFHMVMYLSKGQRGGCGKERKKKNKNEEEEIKEEEFTWKSLEGSSLRETSFVRTKCRTIKGSSHTQVRNKL